MGWVLKNHFLPGNARKLEIGLGTVGVGIRHIVDLIAALKFSVTNHDWVKTLGFLSRTDRFRQFLHVDRSGTDFQSCNCVQKKFASLGIRGTGGGLAIQ